MTCPAGVKTSVCPSFADANTCTPTIPSAPGRLSTTTGCRQRSDSRGARRRATKSLRVPGPNGTMTVTGRVGHWDIRAVVGLWLREPALLAAEQAARPHVFVDEFQDTDPAQVELLTLLPAAVVTWWPSATPTSPSTASAAPTSPASANSRPVPHRRRRPGAGRRARHLPPVRGRAAPAAAGRRAGSAAAAAPRPAARERAAARELVGRRARSEAQEAAYVADGLRRAHLVDGVPWSQMAVLVRRPCARPVLRRAMVAAGVPVAVSGDEVPLGGQPGRAPAAAPAAAAPPPGGPRRGRRGRCSPRRSAAPT